MYRTKIMQIYLFSYEKNVRPSVGLIFFFYFVKYINHGYTRAFGRGGVDRSRTTSIILILLCQRRPTDRRIDACRRVKDFFFFFSFPSMHQKFYNISFVIEKFKSLASSRDNPESQIRWRWNFGVTSRHIEGRSIQSGSPRCISLRQRRCYDHS